MTITKSVKTIGILTLFLMLIGGAVGCNNNANDEEDERNNARRSASEPQGNYVCPAGDCGL